MPKRHRMLSTDPQPIFRLVIAILIFSLPAQAAPNWKELTIAVVRDGPGPEDQLVDKVEAELPGHLPRDVRSHFDRREAFSAAWDQSRAHQALESALVDDSIDAIILIGSLVSEAAGREAVLAKPVLSAQLQRPDFLRVDPGIGSVRLQRSVASEVETFRDLVPFSKLHLVVAAEDADRLHETSRELFEAMERAGVELQIVAAHVDDPGAALADMSKAEAVLLTRLQRHGETERHRLIDGLNREGIPSFSLRGHPDVHLGALAAATPPVEEQLVRRIAINIARLVRGEPIDELLSSDRRLLVNAQTAAAIDALPPLEQLLSAEILHPEYLEPQEEALDFARLMELTQQNNPSIHIADAEVAGARQDELLARSALRPQIRSALSYNYLDTDSLGDGEAGFGALSITQQIYDDGARSGARSASSLYMSALSDQKTVRLDQLTAAGKAYYNLALARADYRVVLSDLQLTQDHLELAKLRQDVGVSGRAEVIRFESVLAERRSSVLSSAETVEATRIALNQILGVPQTRRFAPEIPDINPDIFPAFSGRLDKTFDRIGRREGPRRALVDFAIAQAPELASIRAAIAAQKTRAEFLRRRFVVPRISGELGYTEAFQTPEGPFLTADDSLSISVSVSYSLFEGGARRAELARAQADLGALESTAALIRQRIEQRTRTALRRIESSFPRIGFARRAAALAAESLDLVREQYRLGTVNVTDLLDAQSQRLSAEQFANAAVFDFLSDYVELQRALAFFESEKTPEERDAFVELLLSTGRE